MLRVYVSIQNVILRDTKYEIRYTLTQPQMISKSPLKTNRTTYCVSRIAFLRVSLGVSFPNGNVGSAAV